MALPALLKNMNLFNEGRSWLGEVAAVTIPTLTRKLEEYRGAAMDGPIKYDMGGEALEQEATYGGPMRDILRQFGHTSASGVYQRFVGFYQDDSTGTTHTVEITTRGRHEELEFGEQKPGEPGEFKVKSALTYYRLEWDGVTEIEIDRIGMVFMVGGVDRLAEQRAAIL